MITALLIVLGMLVGSVLDATLTKAFWRRYDYCPVCDRMMEDE